MKTGRSYISIGEQQLTTRSRGRSLRRAPERERYMPYGARMGTESFFDYIDTSYDTVLEENKSYTWLPWVGKNFLVSEPKILILGESTYNWAKDEGARAKINERLKKPDHLRIVHKNNAIDFKGKSPYARNIERAILLKKKVSRPEAERIWMNVVYHNLVIRAMHTPKHRPKYDDYLEGWHCFIDLVKKVPISQCIVYGVETSKIKSLKEALYASGIKYEYRKIKPGIGRSFPKVMIIDVDGEKIKLLFVRHPSSFFSWEKWGRVLMSELNLNGLSVTGI